MLEGLRGRLPRVEANRGRSWAVGCWLSADDETLCFAPASLSLNTRTHCTESRASPPEDCSLDAEQASACARRLLDRLERAASRCSQGWVTKKL